MDPLYEATLNGTLVSTPDSSKPYSQAGLVIINETPFTVTLRSISESGALVGWTEQKQQPGLTPQVPIIPTYAKGGNTLTSLAPGAINRLTNIFEGDILACTATSSGGFVAAIKLANKNDQQLPISTAYLTKPNDIGSVPKPTQQMLIPPDSQRIVVGAGVAMNSSSVMREQCWQRLSDSYSLAPGAKKQISYTLVTGMQNTTSQQDTIAASLGLNTSAGWGPISASVSASLSINSTTFQQQTYSTQSTTFTSMELYNDGKTPQTLFVWQLTDIVTIFDSKGVPLGSIVTGGEPSIVDGPHNFSDLPQQLSFVTAQELLSSS